MLNFLRIPFLQLKKLIIVLFDLLEQINNADSAENAVILADLIKTTLAERNAIIKNSR